MLTKFFDNEICFSLEQEENALSPIAVTESGIVISVKLSQLPIHLLLSQISHDSNTYPSTLYASISYYTTKRKKQLFKNILRIMKFMLLQMQKTTLYKAIKQVLYRVAFL